MEDTERFLEYVKNNNKEAIKELIRKNKFNLLKPTVIERACEEDEVQPETLEILLEASEQYDAQKLFEIVSKLGYFNKVNLFKNKNVKVTTEILCNSLKLCDRNDEQKNNCNFDLTSHILLDKIESEEDNEEILNIIIGHDLCGYTPLHYSLRHCDKKITAKILQLGASLACKSKSGSIPAEDIESSFFKECLDSFNTTNKTDKVDEKIYFEVIFSYENLIPPKIKNENPPDVEAENIKYDFQIETELIHFMSKNSKLRPLVEHPVIICFLLTKWYRLKYLFYFNFIFYLIFLASLTVYTLNFYSQPASNPSYNFLNVSSLCIYHITFLILCLREIFQGISSPKFYLRNYSNVAEIVLILVCFFILYTNSSHGMRKLLSSIAILLSYYELLIMAGQYPSCSKYVIMFTTVSKKFLKLFFVYSSLITAFAFTFHIIFASTNNKTEIDTTEKDPFINIIESVTVKTSVMLTGEFNYESLKFDNSPITSKSVFCLFIFMIPIILVNLLNGLAISDIKKIEDDAELVGYVALTQQIYYIENILANNVLDGFLNKIFRLRISLLSTFKNINIFNEEKCNLYVYPNLHGIVSTKQISEIDIEKIDTYLWYKRLWHKITKVSVNDKVIEKILDNVNNKPLNNVTS